MSARGDALAWPGQRWRHPSRRDRRPSHGARLCRHRPLQRSLHPSHQVVRLERLGDEIAGARSKRVGDELVVRVGADHDDLDAGGGGIALDLGTHRDAAHLRHGDVEQHQVRPLHCQQLEGELAAVDLEDLEFVSAQLKAVAYQPPRERVVVYDQDLGHCAPLLPQPAHSPYSPACPALPPHVGRL